MSRPMPTPSLAARVILAGRAIVLLIAVTLVLTVSSGCGRKGALRLPEDESTRAPAFVQWPEQWPEVARP